MAVIRSVVGAAYSSHPHVGPGAAYVRWFILAGNLYGNRFGSSLISPLLAVSVKDWCVAAV